MGFWIKKNDGTATLPIVAHVVNSLTASNPTVNAPSVQAVKNALSDYWLQIYPVGSVYINTTNIDPSEVFGGTWQPIKDKFLLASGDIYNNGAEGGEATHTLTTEELPSHTHNYDKANAFTNDYTLTVNDIPSHSHNYQKAAARTNETTLTTDQIPSHTHTTNVLTTGSNTASAPQNILSQTGDYMAVATSATGGGLGHDHGINSDQNATSSTGGGGAHSHGINKEQTATSGTGSGSAHNNMPPYIAVNVWVRTA